MTEKAKRDKLPKSQPNPISQNDMFFLITFVLGIMIFFRLDVILDAVALKEFYPVSSIAMFFTLLIITGIIIYRKNNEAINEAVKDSSGEGCLFLLQFTCGLVSAIITGSFSQWSGETSELSDQFSILMATINTLLPTRLLIVAFFGTLIIWQWTKRSGMVFSEKRNSILTVMFLFIGSFYVIGAGRYVDNTETGITVSHSVAVSDHMELQGKHFFYRLLRYRVDRGFRYQTRLYQCNSLAFACEIVHNAPMPVRLLDEDIYLEQGSSANKLTVRAGDETVFLFFIDE